jgi:hypothetical protein
MADGPALFAGGFFHEAGGLAANGVARFDGSGWSALAEGAGGVRAQLRRFAARAACRGDFVGSPAGDSYVASWSARRKAIQER